MTGTEVCTSVRMETVQKLCNLETESKLLGESRGTRDVRSSVQMSVFTHMSDKEHFNGARHIYKSNNYVE